MQGTQYAVARDLGYTQKDSERDGAHRTRMQIWRRGNRHEAPTGLLKWLEKAE